MVAPRIVVAAHLVAGVAHAHASARWVATGVSDDAVIDRYEGIVLFDLSKRDEAIAAFKEAVSLEPDAPLSALVVLVLNPTWGVRIDGDTLKWWHDGRGEERTVSLTELCAVRVDREADVAALESTSGIHVVVPRECLEDSAQAWALQLHQRYPHIEFFVS